MARNDICITFLEFWVCSLVQNKLSLMVQAAQELEPGGSFLGTYPVQGQPGMHRNLFQKITQNNPSVSLKLESCDIEYNSICGYRKMGQLCS